MFGASLMQRRKKTGYYEFRRSVPTTLQAVIGKTEIVRSLKTKDKETAKVRNLDGLRIETQLVQEGEMGGLSVQSRQENHVIVVLVLVQTVGNPRQPLAMNVVAEDVVGNIVVGRLQEGTTGHLLLDVHDITVEAGDGNPWTATSERG